MSTFYCSFLLLRLRLLLGTCILTSTRFNKGIAKKFDAKRLIDIYILVVLFNIIGVGVATVH